MYRKRGEYAYKGGKFNYNGGRRRAKQKYI